MPEPRCAGSPGCGVLIWTSVPSPRGSGRMGRSSRPVRASRSHASCGTRVSMPEREPSDDGARASERALSSYASSVDEKGDITVRQAGRKGGKKTATKHGADFYREIGRRGGQARKKQLGAGGYADLGRKGGEARKGQLGSEGYAQLGRRGAEARQIQPGSEGYAQLGRKGGRRVAELIKRGKRPTRGKGPSAA